MHIWAKLALSTQEINTKHNSILNDSYTNYLNIQSSINNNTPIDKTNKFNGIIDRIFYAGELKIDQNNNVYINFLSGTFMRDKILCDNPPEETTICIKRFVENIIKDNENIKVNSVNIDTTCKTFINKNMTRDLLDNYITNIGLKVGVFNNRQAANDFNRKSLNLAKLRGKIDSKKKLKPQFQNVNEITKLQQEYDDLLSNDFGMVEYTPQLGGSRAIKHKTKRRRYRKKNNKHSKKNNHKA
jgi:hypothetical protein